MKGRRHPQNNLANPPSGTVTREHDQFYTSRTLIEYVVALLRRSVLSEYDTLHWVDFSAGTNDFLHTLAPTHSTAFDIAPRSDDVVCRDWFSVSAVDVPSEERDVAVCFNPPFGVRTVLARRFLRHALNTFAPRYFVLVAPLSAWTFLRDRYLTRHVEATPRNSFYTIESDGRSSVKNMRVTIVVLERRAPNESVAKQGRVETSTEHVEHARRKPADVAPYDLFIGSNGDAAAGRTMFVRNWTTDKWSLYRNGLCVEQELIEPSLCVTTGMFTGIRFRREHVTEESAVHEIARRMPTMLPPSLYYTTPASVSLRDMLVIIERILGERLL